MARNVGGTTSGASLLIIIGAILLVFPEPTTSGLGLILLLIGLLLWFL
ncbi:hypothetical protein SAMN04487950_3251 [Halogranum rubrum]|uniref:Uncharacterized protein n=2 Tax=Halogranum rubrum TaxID=553466 RepID=A0A1I4GEY1_9EURY|nr:MULTISPECIES: hypothetical protein [Halogranum]EJN59797.1 hypothetical protein HSB1_19550 [Halogranum salarium B-1]SFL28565.1 hypothetical protein SAMN04487950_3251 [Halogranum rubrum]